VRITVVKKKLSAKAKLPPEREGFTRSGAEDIWSPWYQNKEKGIKQEVGAVLEGRLIKRDSYFDKKATPPKQKDIYTFELAGQEIKKVFPPTRLERKMSAVRVGADCIITFLGDEATSQGGTAHEFDVMYKNPADGTSEDF